MPRSYDIIGYTYKADKLCPPCTAYKVCTGATLTNPPLIDEAIAMIEVEAVARDIDIDSSFDNSTFPKAILWGTLSSDTTCATCGEMLV